MNAAKAKRLSLILFISFLVLSAIIAIFSVMAGAFGDFQFKVLVTTFSISSASICAMSCAAYIERTKERALGLFGVCCSLSATLMVNGGVWLDPSMGGYWKLTIMLIVLSIAFAHALRDIHGEV